MDLTKLSDEELVNGINALCIRDRETTLSLLYHLAELDRRSLYLELGYSSLFDYCTKKLQYSEGGACRRIKAARCISENPELAPLFLQGKVTLCTILAAANGLMSKSTTSNEIAGKSQLEVKELLSSLNPVSKKPREIVKPVTVGAIKTSLIPDTPKDERYELRFTVAADVYQKLTDVRSQLSNSLGNDLSLEALFSKLLEHYLKPKATKVSSKTSYKNIRYIPQALRRSVMARDNFRCTYVAKDGTCCKERHFLHIDHIKPVACGGRNDYPRGRDAELPPAEFGIRQFPAARDRSISVSASARASGACCPPAHHLINYKTQI